MAGFLMFAFAASTQIHFAVAGMQLETVDDLRNQYNRIFVTGNRNAASHLWSTFILDRASTMSASTLEMLFTGFCPISGSPLPDSPHTRYWEVLTRIDGSHAGGIAHHCCWPCLCDEQDWTRVDKKTVPTLTGSRTFDVIVIGNPCQHKDELEKSFVDPFSGMSTTLQQEAPEVRCTGGGLSGATLSDGGFPIIGLFFTDDAFVKKAPFINATTYQDECAQRKAAGFNSGMGLIFDKVASITTIGGASEADLQGIEMKVEEGDEVAAADDQCQPNHAFSTSDEACEACHACRSKNKCPCSSFKDAGNVFFCYDPNAPDLLEGGDLHNTAMHCDVLTKNEVRTCAENAVQVDESSRLFEQQSMHLYRPGFASVALAAVASILASVVIYKRLYRRPQEASFLDSQMAEIE